MINTVERQGRSMSSSDTDVFVGVLECDVLLGAVDSLKYKRAVLRPVLARLRRLDVAVTEAGDPDRHRRALIAIATVAGEAAHVRSGCSTPASGRSPVRWKSNCSPPGDG